MRGGRDVRVGGCVGWEGCEEWEMWGGRDVRGGRM